MYRSIKDDQMEFLESLSLGELRTLGQSFGVKSPTSLSKAELIHDILLIMYGDEEDMLMVETRGRNKEEVKPLEYEASQPIVDYTESYTNYDVVRAKLASGTADYTTRTGKNKKQSLEEGLLKKAKLVDKQRLNKINNGNSSYTVIKNK